MYHPHYIMIFSQYLRFPQSVSFHHSSISIHPPPTIYNVFLPVLPFSPVSIIPPLLYMHPSTTHAVKCFSPSTSVFPCQYHSTIAPYPSIHHLRRIMFFSQYFSFPCQCHSTFALYPSIQHSNCKMFFSQYFSFPLSVSFHHCSISIHLPPTVYNIFFPVLQSSPVINIPPFLHIHPCTTHAV